MNSYTKIGWINGQAPPISAGNLNHMDDGIEAATQAIQQIETALSSAVTRKAMTNANIDSCTETDVLYYGTVTVNSESFAASMLCTGGSSAKAQIMLTASGKLLRRTGTGSTITWGTWDDLTDFYKKSETYSRTAIGNLLSDFMELAPNTTLSALESIADGQLFRVDGDVYLRTDLPGDTDDYIELVSADGVYKKVQIDSSFMKLAPTAAPGSDAPSLNKGQVFFNGDKVYLKTKGVGYNDFIEIANADNVYTKTQTYKKAEVNSLINDVKAYIGYTDSDVVGLQVDLEHSRFTRLGAAEELPVYSVGDTDYAANKAAVEAVFDQLPMYGGRRRCNVADDGTINAFYGEQGYTDDGTNGQVMVYQPAFWYKVVPLKLEKNTAGLGYHIRKANYYVSGSPKAGFKLHPLFYDAAGNPVDHVLLSAYEGIFYDVSASAYVNETTATDTSISTGDLLCSVGGQKPISGYKKALTKAKFEEIAQNRGTGWHLDTYKSVAANQLLMMIELGQLNTQNAIGRGVVDINSSTYNYACTTGSTASLGNGTGSAASTICDHSNTQTVYTVDGKLSISYRGQENPWGNIFKHVNGLNIWGDGTVDGGQVYISDGFTYSETSHTGDYKASGISLHGGLGYISALGYGSEEFDWVFIPSEINGNSSVPVGDQGAGTADLNGYKCMIFGGHWRAGDQGGEYYAVGTNDTDYYKYNVGGRLLYVPTAAA